MASYTNRDEFNDLWCATLELFVHQVLYYRRVYTQDSFTSTRFLGIQSRINRHPDVVKYISETVQMAVKALLEGDSDEVCLEIYNQETLQVTEKYSLNFDKSFAKTQTTSGTDEREREIRELLLCVQNLGATAPPKWTPETTFRIMLFLPSEMKSCNELRDAMSDGDWICSGGAEFKRTEERRIPVHQMMKSGCCFYSTKKRTTIT